MGIFKIESPMRRFSFKFFSLIVIASVKLPLLAEPMSLVCREGLDAFDDGSHSTATESFDTESLLQLRHFYKNMIATPNHNSRNQRGHVKAAVLLDHSLDSSTTKQRGRREPQTMTVQKFTGIESLWGSIGSEKWDNLFVSRRSAPSRIGSLLGRSPMVTEGWWLAKRTERPAPTVQESSQFVHPRFMVAAGSSTPTVAQNGGIFGSSTTVQEVSILVPPKVTLSDHPLLIPNLDLLLPTPTARIPLGRPELDRNPSSGSLGFFKLYNMMKMSFPFRDPNSLGKIDFVEFYMLVSQKDEDEFLEADPEQIATTGLRIKLLMDVYYKKKNEEGEGQVLDYAVNASIRWRNGKPVIEIDAGQYNPAGFTQIGFLPI